MPREGLQRYLPYAPGTAEGGARGETPLPLPTHRAVGRGSGPAGRDPPRAAGLSRGLPGTAPPGWEGCWGGRGGEPLGSSILRTLRAKGTRCPMFHLPPPHPPPASTPASSVVFLPLHNAQLFSPKEGAPASQLLATPGSGFPPLGGLISLPPCPIASSGLEAFANFSRRGCSWRQSPFPREDRSLPGDRWGQGPPPVGEHLSEKGVTPIISLPARCWGVWLPKSRLRNRC